MKKLFLSISLLFSASLYAQTPNAFNYQAVARGSSGSALPSQTISVEFTIHDALSGGTVLYQETQTLTTNQFGLFSCQIGTGTVVSGTFATIDWAGNLKFLQVGFDPAGGSSFTDMGTTQLISVAYAKVADVALNGAWAASGNNIVNTNSGHVYVGGTPSIDAGLVVRGSGIFNSAIGIEDANTDMHWSMEVDGNNFVITKGTGSTFSPFILESTGDGGFLNSSEDTSMWIANSGNVGIGTSTPGYALNVSSGNEVGIQVDGGDGSWSGMYVNASNTSADAFYGYKEGDAIKAFTYSDNNGDWGVNCNNSNSGYNLTVLANGAVGIGTRTPTGQLSVINNGSGLGAPSIYTSNTNAAGIGMYITTNSTDATAVFTNAAGSTGGAAIIAKFFDGGASDLIRIDNSNGANQGRVSMFGDNTGTNGGGFVSAFTNGLELGDIVSGAYTTLVVAYHPTSNTTALVPNEDDVTSCGSATYHWNAVYASNGTIQTSDERLKENVQPLSHGLNELMSLKPVSYQWKNEHARIGNGSNLGFLAQDLEKVLPEVVVHTQISQEEIDNAKKYRGKDITNTDTYGVKYSEIIPVLVKAIQEQQAEIEALKIEIKGEQK